MLVNQWIRTRRALSVHVHVDAGMGRRFGHIPGGSVWEMIFARSSLENCCEVMMKCLLSGSCCTITFDLMNSVVYD